MITNKMIARRVSAFGLALTGLMAMVNVPTKAAVSNTDTPVADYCYALAGGGGWTFGVAHDFDVDNNGTLDNRFVFMYGRTISIHGSVSISQNLYNREAKSVTFFASGMNIRTPVAARIEIQAIGGRYQNGTAVLYIHNDANGNGVIDAGEAPLFPRPLSFPLTGLMSNLR